MKTPEYYSLNPEPVKVIDSWNLSFELGNTLKYIARAGRKTPDPIKDLKKARHYIDLEIERINGNELRARKNSIFQRIRKVNFRNWS